MALHTAASQVTLRDLTVTFDTSARRAAQTTFYPQVCNVIDSDSSDEKYAWLGDIPSVREFVGDRIYHQLRSADYELKNKTWEVSQLIDRHKIADDRLNFYTPVMSMMGTRAAQHPDNLLFQIILAGESSLCYDGQFFFDTDHVWGDSGSQSNDLTYNASDPNAVTQTEFEAAYNAARTQMLTFKDDTGEFLIQPTVTGLSNLMLVVPPELEVIANKTIRSVLVGGGNTNIILDAPQIVVSPFLTNATKFYLLHLDQALKPFVFQARASLSREMMGQNSIEKKDVKFHTEARYNVGYLAWWNAVLTTFT